MDRDVFEIEGPDGNWLIIVTHQSGESIHGRSITRRIIATTEAKHDAQTVVDALRAHFGLP